jgi:hypothetical protein
VVTLLPTVLATSFALAAQAPEPPPMLPSGREAVERALQRLTELPLPAVAARIAVIRLVVVPAFPSRRIAVVRAKLGTDGMEVRSKVLGDWFPSQGKAMEFPVRHLPLSRWRSLDEGLVPGLWEFSPAPFPNPTVHDGGVWFLESTGPRGHLAVIQHAPGPSPFRDICEQLLRLSAIDFTEDEFISWFTH